MGTTQPTECTPVPYRFDLDSGNRILRLSYIGQISDELIKKAYKATPNAVQRTNPRGMIIDLSDVTEFNVSTQTIHELADLKPTVKDPSVPRIIVAPTPYLFGMSRMFQILGGQTRPMLQVMNSTDAAYTELDIKKPKFEPLPESWVFMPYHFDFDPINKILRAKFDGYVDDDEMRRYYFQDSRKLVTKVQFDAAIVDLSAITKFEISSSMIGEMAAYKPVIATVPIFIVAPAPHIFGTSRMFQIMGAKTRPQLHVVRSANEAYEQLQVVEPKFKPIPED